MGLANISVALRRSNVAPNPQDRTALALVVGPSSKGTLNAPQTFTSLAQIADGAGDGPGAELAGAILGVAGGPVQFVPSAKSTPGAAGAVTKTDPAAAVGVPFTLYGGLILPGVDLNGRVFIRAKADGVTVRVIQGADGDTLLASVVGTAITIRAAAAAGAITTTAALLAAYVLPGPVAALIEQPVAYGTGASLIITYNPTPLDGKLVITPLVPGPVKIKFSTFTGVSTPLAAAVANSTEITVTPGTNADSQPTLAADSATQVKAAIDAVASALVTVTVGNGAAMSGLGAAENAAAFHSLQFGSTGTMTVTGTPNDTYAVTTEVVRGGLVGGGANLTMRWTADGTLYSGEVLIPANGIVVLKDSYLDTGATVTFSATLAAGDKFSFKTTAPKSNVADVLAAIDGALADSSRQWGFVTSSESFTKANAVLLDGKLQGVWAKRFARGMFAVRDIAEGVPGETRQQWADAMTADFAGFVSGSNAATEAGGLLDFAAAPVLHLSPLSLRQFRRPGTFATAVRKASIPAHEDLGKVATGPMRNVLAIYHDEAVTPQLDAQRFITTRTYDARPGSFYLTGSPTMADATNVAYALVQWVAISLTIARLAKEAAFTFLRDSLQAIGAPDAATGAPAGALTVGEKATIESLISAPVRKFLFLVKSDGKQSASPYADGEKPVEVLRTNNFVLDRTVNMEVAWRPLGVAELIKIGVTSKLGE